ncbi:MAG: site-specific DNA-methyltransferase [Clostridium sp.]|uniref:site-specific DNA-methyltransferase n=1 Tax=Clostridium sp. TaxID=1506 RepID=UPI00267409CE|nr:MULTISPECIES: site-specific DNA-methyltransferase [Clostridium]MDU4318611.1 site-specific DNA-methyltransferase [Clostridium sp.]MDU6809279.1 site-specific DNA-methyltransferase [Clostridium sp.]
MDKLKMHTKSKVDINIESIGALFPNTVTETIRGYDENNNVIIEKAIDFDILKQELSKVIVEGREERYQMNWPGKKEAILTANTPINKTLRPCREDSVNFDDTENLYIEGDNLEVLKLLQETYLNRVKMIYIDPPYNTGNDSFVYNNNFQMSNEQFSEASGQYDEYGNLNYDIRKNNESNGKFHTDWLNMMYPRLKLAKDLLKDDGVIFISIDDNEVENMKKVCNEIFGEQNYAATFIWTKTSTPPSLSYKCRKTVEYVLAYEKNISPQKYFGNLLDGGDVPFLNSGNPIKTIVFPPHSVQLKFIKDGVIPAGIKEKVVLENELVVKDGWNQNEVIITGEFKWEQNTVNNEIKNGTYFVIKSKKFSIRFQRTNLNDAYKTPTNFLNIELNKEVGVGTNETAVKELKILDLDKFFDYPKPISLIEQILQMVCKMSSDAIVIDFFSGSATTANAIMKLNAEDGGKRKFIMVQLPEVTDDKSEARKAGYENICEIGKERIRRAGKKIIDENPEVADKLDIGFRVLKLDSSNMKDVYYNPNEYTQDMLSHLESNIKDDRTSEDLLFQVMLDLGELLSSDIREIGIEGKKVFNVGDGNIVACFDDEITNEVLTEIAKIKPLYAVFRDSALSNDSVATNFEQIFKTYSPNTIRKVL